MLYTKVKPKKLRRFFNIANQAIFFFAISCCWVLVLRIPINRSYWNTCWLKPVQLFQQEDSILPKRQNKSWEFFDIELWLWHLPWIVALRSSRASCLDAHFWFRFALGTSTLALVLDKHLWLRFKFRGNFRLRASRSSTTSVFAVWLWSVLWASLRASAGALSIGWMGRRWHRGRALALNQAWTGNPRSGLKPGFRSIRPLLPNFTPSLLTC